MFDVGFTELLLIGVIGLLILGPERLPVTVKKASLYIGRLRKQFSEIKAEVEREIGADEIRNQIHNESIMRDLNKTRDAINSTAQAMKNPVRSMIDSASKPDTANNSAPNDAIGDNQAGAKAPDSNSTP